eukprot:CAMPEP_0169093562 /NCGR_PEP_ID=MMETSP1015-20121227/17500_1 /TAXON_ID=342587 /ORGANISM="Karlodinium micrum, Strain CCMP2283" /LENGTH=52 /DNA_ID=CAMNT_0009154205 /DNA_START=36 /DNA_END=194 /DNA_ORIENTATION=+
MEKVVPLVIVIVLMRMEYWIPLALNHSEKNTPKNSSSNVFATLDLKGCSNDQ